MALTRSYTYSKGGRSPLVLQTFVDTGTAGGEAVLTAKTVPKGETPTVAGIFEIASSEWAIISIKNRSASPVTWEAKPKIRGTNEHDIDPPVFGDGYPLTSEATIGSFGTTIEAGDEQAVKVFSDLAGWGFLLQADIPTQAVDLAIYILTKPRGRN